MRPPNATARPTSASDRRQRVGSEVAGHALATPEPLDKVDESPTRRFAGTERPDEVRDEPTVPASSPWASEHSTAVPS